MPQFIIVDKDGLSNISSSSGARATGAQVANPASKLMLTDATIEADFVPTFRKVTGGEVSAGAIGSVFMVINTIYAGKEMCKATHFNSTETKVKFVTALTTMASGASGLSGATLEAAHGAQLKLPSFLSADMAEGLSKASRWLGAPAAIVGVVYDAMNTVEQWKAGHVGLAIAYFSSTVAGALLGICVTFGVLTSWILPLTILLIAIGLVIMYFKERELKEFLGRSYFGTNKKDDKYRSLAEEQKAYAGLGA